MKTAALEGVKLDYWVAKADGETPVPDTLRPGGFVIGYGRCIGTDFSPSTNWAQGGPIIEREKITLMGERSGWFAEARFCTMEEKHDIDGCRQVGRAETPLVAAMRAYIASKFGEDVPDA